MRAVFRRPEESPEESSSLVGHVSLGRVCRSLLVLMSPEESSSRAMVARVGLGRAGRSLLVRGLFLVALLPTLVLSRSLPAVRGGRWATAARKPRALVLANLPVAAAQPDPSLIPQDVARTCMDALSRNDWP
ncbi:hypothetical protein T492DRAFT_838485 [Pavlovales sp. CCMP2436]|nr:hypothetical protein T492DRAFT_838485 [Pavlovales sp. CCMP2436]